MFKYNPRVLVVFIEAFKGNLKMAEFLLEYYPELAAFIGAIKNDEKGYDWLTKHKFLRLAALHDALDSDFKAYKWLQDNKYMEDAIFAKAVHKDQDAIEWLNKNYPVLRHVAELISTYHDNLQKKDDTFGAILQKIVKPLG